MGWSDQNVIAQLVIITGPDDGEFVYDSSGHLRSANVGAVTADPVHGITCQQGFSTFNAFGAVINLLSTTSAAAGFFQYFDNESAVQGALILSIASTTGSDPVTSTGYPAGQKGTDPIFGDFIELLGAHIDIANATWATSAAINASGGTPSGATGPWLEIDSPTATGAPGISVLAIFGESPDTTIPAGVVLATAASPVKSTPALLEVLGVQSLQSGGAVPASTAGFTLIYSDSSAQLHTDRAFVSDVNIEIKNLASPPGAGGSGTKFYSHSGHGQVQSGQTGAGGDTGTYDCERLTAVIAQQTVTSSPTVTLASAPVGASTYHVKVLVPYRGALSAGTAVFAFTSPTASVETTVYRNALSSAGFGANGTVTWSINPQSSFTGTFTSPTLSTTSVNVLEVDAIVTFSASGTLAFTCKAGTAGDNVSVFTGYMEVMPVIAT